MHKFITCSFLNLIVKMLLVMSDTVVVVEVKIIPRSIDVTIT